MRDFTKLNFSELWRGRRGEKSPIKLVGIRDADLDGVNRMSIYDDAILRLIDGTWSQWRASTDPSWPLVMHAINPDGAAQLCPGEHMFEKHWMHDKYPCLGQAEPVHVNRLDSHGNVKFTECGQFGICIHSGGVGPNGELDTGRFSAGCQIIQNTDGYFRNPTWENFWGPIRDGMSKLRLKTVPYLLINASDVA